jgi:uncharacterized protein (TIGR02246 family)
MARSLALLTIMFSGIGFGTAQAPQPRGVTLGSLSPSAARSQLTASVVVVIPLQPGSVASGPDDPLSADARVARQLTTAVQAAASVVIAPPLTYHYYPASSEYPGSTTLSLPVARDMGADVIRSLARSGPRRFYILNTGTTTIRVLQQTARLLEEEGILLRYTQPPSAVAGPDALLKIVLDDIEQLRTAPLPPARRLFGSSSNTGAVMPPRPSGCTEGDEREIRNLGPRYQIAWRNLDAETIAGMFMGLGDMRHPDGMVERGQETIKANRQELFRQKVYQGSRHIVTLMDIRCVGPDVAIADGKWELRDLVDDKGNRLTFNGLCTLVVRRRGSDWAIEAWRYTITPVNVPVGPTILKQPGWPKDK